MSGKYWLVSLLMAALGFAAGIFIGQPGNFIIGNAALTAETGTKKKEILYWAAPMDPAFRSDEPGKSPMGMDLVPVYTDEVNAGDRVTIDPVIVQNLGVRTAAVERGKLWRRIDTVGYIGLDERKVSHVHLRTDGWIDKLMVKSDGERVAKGDLLMEVYSRELVSAQEEYLQALRAGNDALKRASRERLIALGIAEEQIREVEKTRRSAQLVRIHARQSGVVTDLKIREGMYVQPAMEVMSLADLSSVWLLVDVFERQSDWVKLGMPAEAELAYQPGKRWEGKVEFVYPMIDPKTRTLRVRLRFDNPEESLKPGMYAKVRINAGPKDDVLSIPREALIRTGKSQRVILALGAGHFDARDVVAGMESGEWVEIIRGLAEGERIVTSGQFLLDSEASLKASFNRMGIGTQEQTAKVEVEVTGMGTVNAVSADAGTLNISHNPIEVLGWPAMTMDFKVTDDLVLNGVAVGNKIHFVLLPDDTGSYRISEIHVVE